MEKLKCQVILENRKICGKEFTEGGGSNHFKKCHNVTKKEYIELFPWQFPSRVLKEYIICKKCGKKLKMITRQHLVKCSNITLEEYKEQFPNAEIITSTLKKYRINNCKELLNKTRKTNCIKCGKELEVGANINWPRICKECSKPETYKEKKFLKNKDKVVCQICWQAFDQLTDTHLKSHNLTLDKYREKFPNILVTNRRIREERGENASKINWTKEKRENASRGHIWSIESWYREHPLLKKFENLRYDDRGRIQGQCKNPNCLNSKEIKGWYTLKRGQLAERVRCIEANKGQSYLFCCKECSDAYRIFRGEKLSPERYKDFIKYHRTVSRVTSISIRDNKSKIPNISLRGTKHGYSLDHKFSIREGFEQSTHPKIIGHWKNLEMIDLSGNCRKNRKCSITLQELIEEIKFVEPEVIKKFYNLTT